MGLLDQKAGPSVKYGNQSEVEDVDSKAHDGRFISR